MNELGGSHRTLLGGELAHLARVDVLVRRAAGHVGFGEFFLPLQLLALCVGAVVLVARLDEFGRDGAVLGIRGHHEAGHAERYSRRGRVPEVAFDGTSEEQRRPTETI